MFLFEVFCCFALVGAYKILVFSPVISRSHMISNGRIADELAVAGHDVVGLAPQKINLCGNGIAHVLGIRSHFWVSSCPISDHMAWVLGMPQPSSYIPSLIGTDSNHRMSYFERVQNIYYTFLYIYFSELGVFRRKYGADFPNLAEIASNSDMIFVATDEFIEIPRPTLPNVVHIGGIGVIHSSLLQPFAHELEKGAKGVVYFSLGTLVNTTSLPPTAMTTVMNAVKQTPDYHFILVADKYDKFTRMLADSVSNVYICSWAPQPAILSKFEDITLLLKLP
ncbi:unnamed protein product [Strongylus vulgaris]|uniref:glucuronosyltransferase n=1 Tax=Strongylus vulgaris TaxID=40348 RepID=A0A3P7IKQ3_STRVU|nr:unnamed protein product [Strongylus vulgaris]